jgi:type IV secretory pathway TrbL component
MIKRRQVKTVTFLDLKDKREQSNYFFGGLIILSYVLVIVTFPLSLCFCLKVRIFISINTKIKYEFLL